MILVGGIGRAHQAHLALFVFDFKLAQPKVAHQGEQSFYFPQFHRRSKNTAAAVSRYGKRRYASGAGGGALRLDHPLRRAQREEIALRTEPHDPADHDAGDGRVMAKRLARINVG